MCQPGNPWSWATGVGPAYPMAGDWGREGLLATQAGVDPGKDQEQLLTTHRHFAPWASPFQVLLPVWKDTATTWQFLGDLGDEQGKV
jgi:hypothetical protein